MGWPRKTTAVVERISSEGVFNYYIYIYIYSKRSVINYWPLLLTPTYRWSQVGYWHQSVVLGATATMMEEKEDVHETLLVVGNSGLATPGPGRPGPGHQN